MAAIRHIPDIEFEAALLLYIKKRADIRLFLTAFGNDMAHFSDVMDEIFRKGYTVRLEAGLALSEKGEAHLKNLNRRLGRRGLYAMMLPDYSERLQQMSIAEPYIPEYIWKRGDGSF